MNTLWTSLLALIVIALVLVVAVNALQSWRTRQLAAQRERLAGGGDARSARMADQAGPDEATGPAGAAAVGNRTTITRIEPTFGGEPEASVPPADDDWHDERTGDGIRYGTGGETASPADADRPGDPYAAAPVQADRDEPDDSAGAAPVRQAAAPGPAPAAAAAGDDARPVLDERLDCIVELSPTGLVSGERLVTVTGPLRRAGSKPILAEADSGDGLWQPPQAGRSYRRARIGVLLANRHGPLNAMEYSEFGNAVQALGRQLSSQPELPEMARVLEHARALDEACMQLDAQIGLNVETPTALSPGELGALATGLDLIERGNNRYARLGRSGEVLFSLSLGDRANLLTLLLDVPRAPPSAQPWALMLDCAQACAERSGGKLIDDAGRPLTEAAAAAVTRQLEMRYRSLDEAGLTAGSAAALRVFN